MYTEPFQSASEKTFPPTIAFRRVVDESLAGVGEVCFAELPPDPIPFPGNTSEGGIGRSVKCSGKKDLIRT